MGKMKSLSCCSVPFGIMKRKEVFHYLEEESRKSRLACITVTMPLLLLINQHYGLYVIIRYISVIAVNGHLYIANVTKQCDSSKNVATCFNPMLLPLNKLAPLQSLHLE